VLRSRGIHQSELASRTGLSAKHVNQMIKQLIGISPDVAILLERALGTPAQFWVKADADYQAYESRRLAEATLTQFQPWADQFDRTILERHHIIEPADTGTTVVEKVLKFFQVATPAAFQILGSNHLSRSAGATPSPLMSRIRPYGFGCSSDRPVTSR